MSTAEQMANAFQVDANIAPVVNVSGVDAPTVTEAAPTQTQKFYTEEDLAKVRTQEKDKLYPVVEQLKSEVAALKKDKDEKAANRAAKEAEESADKAAKDRNKLIEDLDAKDLIKLTTDELREQLERERSERERAFALLEQERTFTELKNYKQQIIEAERDNIMPQLLKYLDGSTPEELAASAADLKAQTDSILQDAQSAMQNARKEMRGTSTTLPAAGPLETNMDSRQFTAQDIAAMSMNDYAKVRDKLMSDAARGKSRGLLG
jgi:hypothetical protein